MVKQIKLGENILMDLCDKISSAKCCVVSIAEAYVNACTFGNNTDHMRDEYLLMNSYIDALENYDTRNRIAVKKNLQLTDGNFLLADGDKILSLGNSWVEEEVCADDINCLTKDDLCRILEQISISCESCICGC